MSRLALAAALSIPLSIQADPPRAEGHVETDEGRIEILGRPVRVGERVDLPEGWFRVEEAGPEDGEVGSFGVVPVDASSEAGSVIPGGVTAAEDPASGGKAARDCAPERSAYLAELWRQSGIEVSSPGALLQGLDGTRRRLMPSAGIRRTSSPPTGTWRSPAGEAPPGARRAPPRGTPPLPGPRARRTR